MTEPAPGALFADSPNRPDGHPMDLVIVEMPVPGCEGRWYVAGAGLRHGPEEWWLVPLMGSFEHWWAKSTNGNNYAVSRYYVRDEGVAAELVERRKHDLQITPSTPGVRDPVVQPRRLPFNRKERYFTATVLPMLVACDGFRHLGRFLELCGLPPVWDPVDRDAPQLQFLTEYGFAESVFTPEDRTMWPDAVEAATPDVVVAGRDWLLAVEAKMYHNPTAADLASQMGRQSVVIQTWVERLGLDGSRVAHVLLLPKGLAAGSQVPSWKVVTWEHLLDSYREVAPQYWLSVLEEALRRYPQLVSKGPEFGKYAHGKLTGQEIVNAYREHRLPYDHVGRGNGGLTGSLFKKDVDSDGWRAVRYEVREGALPENPNWFSIGEFLAATGNERLLPGNSQGSPAARDG